MQNAGNLVTFRSAQDAVRWAYRTLATEIVQAPSLGRWRGAERGHTENDLTPHERHGEAAQILLAIGRLSDVEHAVIHVECWPEMLDSKREDPSYKMALSILSRAIMGQGWGARSERGSTLIVRQWLADGRGRSHGMRGLRSSEACSMAEAVRRRSECWARLEVYHSRAWDELDRVLSEAGVVGL